MLENQHIRIPKNVEHQDNSDFHFLRKAGIEYIEQLGGRLWTDYNSHDPGITILEVLSYAITDLSMRMNLDMEDILASDQVDKALHKQFIKASEILPVKPVNAIDYRKLFIDIGEEYDENTPIKLIRPIKNCWVIRHEEVIYADCKTGNLAFNKKILGQTTIKDFNVKGLYSVLVDFHDDLSVEEKNAVRKQILERFHANRNLCEDIVEIKEIGTQPVAVCASIEVDKKVDEELVYARIQRKIEQYLAPEAQFHSLKQLLDKGVAADDIFDGPLLQHGFIDTTELENAQLRTEVRLSDLIREIMELEGVKLIREISISNCDAKSLGGDDWVICLEPQKKPVLCDLSSFSFNKGALPLNIDQNKVTDYLLDLEEEEKLTLEQAINNPDIELPIGTAYDLENYSTILNEFPNTYGVGKYGLIGETTPEKEALAKQLKGYLLFFDTVLASYFKHLGKVKDVLSVQGGITKTYFTQALKEINGFEELVNDYSENDGQLTDKLYKALDNSVERRNQVLDHLLARFAEKFSDYTFLMKALFGKSTDEIVLANKETFLSEYADLSKGRGSGYSYWAQSELTLWDTDNISGVQKRIARLLGIKNYNRRDLSDSPVVVYNDGTVENPVYKWKIKGPDGFIFYSKNEHTIEYVASQELYEAIYQSIQIDSEDLDAALQETLNDGDLVGNIQIKAIEDKFYLNVLDKDANIIASVVDFSDPGNIVVTQESQLYDSQEELKEGIGAIIDYFKNDFTEEGIFLVEHLLLKPGSGLTYDGEGIGTMIIENTFKVGADNAVDDTEVNESTVLMSGCIDDCETNVFDPYSYRVSIILPGYTLRFSDPDFRQYAERVIREELPAHVLAKICWVGDRKNDREDATSDLIDFEKVYRQFLIDKSLNSTDLPDSTKKLIDAITNLNNVYPPGRLLDCAQEDADGLVGKIILGQSNI